MKKLFSLLAMLICTALLSSTAFAADDAYSVYQKYVKKSKSISSMELSIVQKMTMESGGRSADVAKESMTVKLIEDSNKNIQMEVKTVNNETGETSFAYFKDNYMYINENNKKQKIKMSVDEALSTVSMTNDSDIDTAYMKDTLKDATVENVEDGVKISYKTKLSDLTDGNGKSIASLLKNSDWPEGTTMSFTNMTTNMTFAKDGMLKSSAHAFSITLDNGILKFKFKINQSLKIKSVNSVTKINYPADLSTYKTVKAS